jgi:hypothetical protein
LGSTKAPSAAFRRTTGRSLSPAFFIASIALRIAFPLLPIASHCSCAGGVSLVLAKVYIADGVNLPLQIDCIFVWEPVRQHEVGLP